MSPVVIVSEEELTLPKPSPMVPNIPPSVVSNLPPRAFNIQDILMNKQGKGGVVHGVPVQTQAPQEQTKPRPGQSQPIPPQPKQNVQDEITRKLAELKNRSSQGNSQTNSLKK